MVKSCLDKNYIPCLLRLSIMDVLFSFFEWYSVYLYICDSRNHIKLQVPTSFIVYFAKLGKLTIYLSTYSQMYNVLSWEIPSLVILPRYIILNVVKVSCELEFSFLQEIPLIEKMKGVKL